MNSMKFDVVALGNHEFDNGIIELARRLGNLKAEVVCANYDFKGTPLEGRRLNNPDQISVAYVTLHGIPHTMVDEC